MSRQRCGGCNEPLTEPPEWMVPPDTYCCSMECYIDVLFADPKALNEFLDETNFDAYHDRPREEYFPILKNGV